MCCVEILVCTKMQRGICRLTILDSGKIVTDSNFSIFSCCLSRNSNTFEVIVNAVITKRENH